MEERIIIPVEAPGLEETTKSVRDMRKELQDLRGQMAKAEGEEFINLNKRASELNAQIARTNSLITNSQSNFTNFNTILGRTTRALLTLDFGAAAEGAAKLQAISKQLTFKEMLSGLRLATRAIWQMTAAIIANPIGLLAVAAAGLVVAVVALKDDIPFLTAAFDFLSGVLDTVIRLFKDFTDSIGLTNFAIKEYTEEVLKSSETKINALREEFTELEAGLQNEITLRRAAGETTTALEIRLRNQRIRLLNDELVIVRNNLKVLEDLTKKGIKLTDEQIEKQKEYNETIKKTGLEIQKLQTDNAAAEIKINLDKVNRLRKQEEEISGFRNRIYDLETDRVSLFLKEIGNKYTNYTNKRFRLERELNKGKASFYIEDEKRIIESMKNYFNEWGKATDKENMMREKRDELVNEEAELKMKLIDVNKEIMLSVKNDLDLLSKKEKIEERLFDIVNEKKYKEGELNRIGEERNKLWENYVEKSERLGEIQKVALERSKADDERIKNLEIQLQLLNESKDVIEKSIELEKLGEINTSLLDEYERSFKDFVKNIGDLDEEIVILRGAVESDEMNALLKLITENIEKEGRLRLEIEEDNYKKSLNNLKLAYEEMTKGLKEGSVKLLEKQKEYDKEKELLEKENNLKVVNIVDDFTKRKEMMLEKHNNNLLLLNKEYGEQWVPVEEGLLSGSTNKWIDHYEKITDLSTSSTARMIDNTQKMLDNTSEVFSQLESIYQNEADTLFRNAILKGELDKRDIKRIKQAEKRQRNMAKASLALDLATATGNTYVAAAKAAAGTTAPPPAQAIAFTTTLSTLLPKIIGGFAQLKAINNQPSLTDGVGGVGGALGNLQNDFNNQISGIPNFSLFQSGIGDTSVSGGQINQTFILESELLSAEERRRVLLNKGSL